jgi:hypothetical protein
MARPYSMSSSSSSPYSGGSGYGYGYAPSSAYLFGRDRDNTSLFDDMRALLSHSVLSFMRFWRARGRRMAITTLRSSVHRLRQNMTYRRVVSFPHMLVLVWVVIMLWGERWAFHSKVESCRWEKWEKWVGLSSLCGTPSYIARVAGVFLRGFRR